MAHLIKFNLIQPDYKNWHYVLMSFLSKINNVNKIKNLRVLFFLLMTGASLSVNALDFFSLYYRVKKGDSFPKIIKKFIKSGSTIDSFSPMIKRTRDANPITVNWKSLRAGKKIKLVLSSDVIDMAKVKKFLKERKKFRKRLERKKRASQKRFKYTLGNLVGQVKVKQSLKELSMNLIKLNANIKYQTKSKYWLTGSLSLAKFLNIIHTDSDNSSSSGIVPEFGLGFGRPIGKVYMTLGYDMLNYYLASTSTTSISLKSVIVHRLALKPYYQLSESFGVFAGLGYLKSLGSEGISGYDFSLGGSYAFGGRKQFTLSPLLYKSDLSTNLSTEGESSTAWVLSFSVSF